MDYSKIDNIVMAGIDTKDAPDFCDAYIESADYNGQPMNEADIDAINEDRDFVHDQVHKWLY